MRVVERESVECADRWSVHSYYQAGHAEGSLAQIAVGLDELLIPCLDSTWPSNGATALLTVGKMPLSRPGCRQLLTVPTLDAGIRPNLHYKIPRGVDTRVLITSAILVWLRIRPCRYQLGISFVMRRSLIQPFSSQRPPVMAKEHLDPPVPPSHPAYDLIAAYCTEPYPKKKKSTLIPGAYRDEHGLPWVFHSVRVIICCQEQGADSARPKGDARRS
ncbi:hypothetical protein BO71DRAFT_56456 [Aspergillus ellipticus CBS 707.79]|uniref:Uncharacterized protein n=1 Tax=Aspergillus ellipticus CBS 707.79 TaxID=1448320 RepID=A0A319D0X5_9EURO|nr:hypothetical protein BO71DRAFT_56456 [Aspergillus ellipticus CBS 707.79]